MISMKEENKTRKDFWRQVFVQVVTNVISLLVGSLYGPTVGAWISENVAGPSPNDRPSQVTKIEPVTNSPEVVTDPPPPGTSSSSPSVGTAPSTAGASPSTELLSKLTPLNKVSETMWGIDKSYSVDGSQYNNSLYDKCYVATCRSRPDFIEFDLGKKYKKLTATVGIYQDARDVDQPAVLTIYLDGQIYGESYLLKGGNGESQIIEIPVDNVMRIRLELAGTDINYKDYENKAFEVVIGNPVLHKK